MGWFDEFLIPQFAKGAYNNAAGQKNGNTPGGMSLPFAGPLVTRGTGLADWALKAAGAGQSSSSSKPLVTMEDEKRMMRQQPANRPAAPGNPDNPGGGSIPGPEVTSSPYGGSQEYGDPFGAQLNDAIAMLGKIKFPQYDVKLDLSDIERSYTSGKDALNSALKAALGSVESARSRSKGTIDGSIADVKKNYKSGQDGTYKDTKDASVAARKGSDNSRSADYKSLRGALDSQKAANIKDALAVAQQSGGNASGAIADINAQYNDAVKNLDGRMADRADGDTRNADSMLTDATSNSLAMAADGAEANADLNAILVSAMNGYDGQRADLEISNGQDLKNLSLQKLQQVLTAKEGYRDKKWQADSQNVASERDAMSQAVNGLQALRQADLNSYNSEQSATAKANADQQSAAAKASYDRETQLLVAQAKKGDSLSKLMPSIIQSAKGDPNKLQELLAAVTPFYK